MDTTASASSLTRNESPASQGDQDSHLALNRPGKRKHSEPPATEEEDEVALVAPLPVFAPAPASLPSFDHLPNPLEFFSTRSHPFNKHGFRYTPCGPSRQSPLPVPPQRQIEQLPQRVRWSWEDRSVFTYVTQDATTVTTDKGWRAVRANVGVRSGTWYWEIKVDRGGGGGGGLAATAAETADDGLASWVRIGVGRRESGLNAPVGVDAYSYGIRDKTGDKVHKSHPVPYGDPFASGQTIGVYLSIPEPASIPSQQQQRGGGARDPRKIMRKRVPIRYKNQLYFEQLEYTSSKEMDELLVDPTLKAKQEEAEELAKKKSKLAHAPGTKLAPKALDESGQPPMRELLKLPNSRVGFSIDGRFQGVAFKDLYDFIPLTKHKVDPSNHRKKDKSNRLVTENHHDDGSTGYYPFVSVFGGGTVTINPGPTFEFPPTENDFEKLVRDESPPPPPPSDDDDGDATRRRRQRWRPLSERYDEFYDEQARLDDLDELHQIKLLADVRAKELARLQRQFDKAERNATAAAAATATAAYDYVASGSKGGGGGGSDGSVTKKAKLSTSTAAAAGSMTPTSELGGTTTTMTTEVTDPAAAGGGETAAIIVADHSQQHQLHEIIGKAKGQGQDDESRGNSPRPGGGVVGVVTESEVDPAAVVKLETL